MTAAVADTHTALWRRRLSMRPGDNYTRCCGKQAPAVLGPMTAAA